MDLTIMITRCCTILFRIKAVYMIRATEDGKQPNNVDEYRHRMDGYDSAISSFLILK